MAFEEISLYAMALRTTHIGIHTLAFTHCNGLAWRLLVHHHGSHTAMGCLRSCTHCNGLAWRLSVYRHGSHTGMEAACLSPWLTHWHSHTGMGAVCLSPWLTHWHGGCLFIAMAHTLAWRPSVYCHGSHTGMEAACLSPWLTHWHSHTGMEAVCLSPWLGLAWRLSVYRHGSHTGIYTLAFNEVPMGIGMVHTLAFTHWHGGCLFIALAHTLAWRLSVYRHGSHTGIGLAWRLRVYRHGSHTGMEAVCLSLAWRLSVYRWHGGCLFIAMAHTLALG